MVSAQELSARIKDFFKFETQEITGVAVTILVTALIFSFRDWGIEEFNLVVGLRNFLLVAFAAAISIVFRIGCQKVYSLSQGYRADFKVWWLGLLISLVVVFITLGRVPVIFLGSTIMAFMIKQRLGEFRYGFSYSQNAVTSAWGIIGNLILAIIFAIFWMIFPESYFFSKAVLLNLVMALTSMMPLSTLDGLHIFFGSRMLYFWLLAGVVLSWLLLLTRTTIGLIVVIIIGSLVGLWYWLTGSEV